MNIQKQFNRTMFVLIIAGTLYSCKKSSSNSEAPKQITKLPTLTTVNINSITDKTAQSGGSISSDGGAAVTARGICWTLFPNPTVTFNKTSDGSGTGIFTSSITNLAPNTTYYVRAYAINSAGTAYGNEVNFVTASTIPVVSIVVSSFYSSSAVIDFKATATGGSPITATGVCWSTSANPTILGKKTVDGSGLGEFISTVNGLKVNATYYLRAYATNKIGTGYSELLTFTTAYSIGQNFAGGKIFFIDATKIHGFVVAKEDQSTGAQWDNTSGTFLTVGAYSLTDGAGNTKKMISILGNSGNAAAIAKACRDGGYSDWFLPSVNQLQRLYSQLTVLYPQTNLPGYLQPTYYWSSTESSSYVGNAWSVHLGGGMANGIGFKTDINYVRAIRAF